MAACNMSTDVALILFPLSIIRRSGLDFYRQVIRFSSNHGTNNHDRLLRLSLLFALGSLVIITTIVRLPLILRDNAQKTRSFWASIEICVACFIAQAPFYQAVYVDRHLGGHSAFTNTPSCVGTYGGVSRSHVTANHTYSQAQRSRAIALGSKTQDDEIGLWTIEKRVSFTVSGRTDNSGEFDRSASSSEMRENLGKLENIDINTGGVSNPRT